MPKTFAMCKPDAVRRGLVGDIINRFERKGLTIAQAELRVIDRATATQHYAEHDGKPFFESLLEFITSGPSMLLVIEGSDDAGDDVFAIVRNLMGSTNPATAAPGTIRGDYGTLLTENLVHGSDSVESATREIAIFFPRQLDN